MLLVSDRGGLRPIGRTGEAANGRALGGATWMRKREREAGREGGMGPKERERDAVL